MRIADLGELLCCVDVVLTLGVASRGHSALAPVAVPLRPRMRSHRRKSIRALLLGMYNTPRVRDRFAAPAWCWLHVGTA